MAKTRNRNESEYQEYLDSGTQMTPAEYAATIGTGAMTGVGAGAAFGPYGMLIGGIAGAGVGIAQSVKAQDAAYEAWKRDQELQAELDAVNNLGDYMAATAVRTSAQVDDAKMSAKQAAARSGVPQIAAEALTQQAISDIEMARSVELASALPAAKQADIMQRQQIVDQMGQRQDLYASAANPPDYISQFGQLAGTAAVLGTLSTGGYAHPGQGTQDSVQTLGDAGKLAAGYLGATDEYGDPIGAEFRDRQPNEAYAEDKGWAPPTLYDQEEAAYQDVQFQQTSNEVATVGPDGREVYSSSLDPNKQDLEQMAFEQQMQQLDQQSAMRDAQLMVASGTVSQSEMAYIVQQNPAALTDSMALQAAVADFQSKKYGSQNQMSGVPGYSEFDYNVNPAEMDQYSLNKFARAMAR